jgi:tetratricopeptide (TPR) repeat protein
MTPRRLRYSLLVPCLLGFACEELRPSARPRELSEDPRAERSLREASAALARGGTAEASALDTLRHLHDRFPRSARVRNILHNALLARQDWEGAIRTFERHPEPFTNEESRHLGRLYLLVGRFDDASKRLAPLADADPANDLLALDAAKAAFGLGDHAAVRARLEGRARLESDREALRLLGLSALELGDGEASIRCLERAVALAPEWAAGHYALGRALHALGRAEDAEPHFARFQKLSAEASARRGEAMWISGRLLEAMEARRERRFGDAIAIAEQVLGVAGDSLRGEVYGFLEEAYRQVGRNEDAANAAARATRTSR